MIVLGIETSCDETAAAVVQDGRRVLSNVVGTQHALHEGFGGVVPEIACRAHAECILPIVKAALEEAEVGLVDLDGIAVTTTPGLVGSLLVGVTAAKALSWAMGLPLLAVDHLKAHIYAVWLGGVEPAMPAASLVVSGGHTSLFLTKGPLCHALLGGTLDDAAGEAFDKVATILRLGYPGGPAIERAADGGDPGKFAFPRSRLAPDSLDFSFSGLKTAVLYHCLGKNVSKEAIASAVHAPQFVADTAASFQEAVVDVLVEKTFAAAAGNSAACVIVGGGVAANGRLRERFRAEAGRIGVALHLAPRQLCTDNAAMTAGLGCWMLEAKDVASLSVEVVP
jgi:N6-L-threonylcarbamoyladenine synthase